MCVSRGTNKNRLEYAASAVGIDKEQQELARQAGHNMKEAAKDVYERVKNTASEATSESQTDQQRSTSSTHSHESEHSTLI